MVLCLYGFWFRVDSLPSPPWRQFQIRTVPAFAFLARDVGAHIANGQYQPGTAEPGLTPFFHVGRFVASFVESIENIMREKRKEDGA
jgi:hypothetical protein